MASEVNWVLPLLGSGQTGFVKSSRFIMFSTQTKLIYFWRLLVWNVPDLNVCSKQETYSRELAAQVQKVNSVLFCPSIPDTEEKFCSQTT